MVPFRPRPAARGAPDPAPPPPPGPALVGGHRWRSPPPPGCVVDGVLQRADDAEARWGTTRAVLVATGPIEPGDPLAGRTEPRRLPAAAVPTARARPASAGGAVAVDAIGPARS